MSGSLILFMPETVLSNLGESTLNVKARVNRSIRNFLFFYANEFTEPQ